MVTHRLQDALLLATHCFDPKSNLMKPIPSGASINVHTTFVLLREGKVIFDGPAFDLVRSEDPYIREYLS
jgi:phospholipid/cholesterol/gamma-HCH transport system ATP-binding protein